MRLSFAHVPGGPLEVVSWGPPPAVAPTLVFLHEGLGSARLWRDFPARLAGATGCGALAYSRAGYGQSAPARRPRPVDYLRREAVDVLPRLLADQGVRDHVLIGHSDGGTIALLGAALAPAPGLRGVITEAAHVFNEPLSVQGIRETVARYEDESSGLRARLARHHRDPEAAFRGWSDVWLSADFRDWNVEAALPQGRAPLLVIQGEADEYGTPQQVEATVAGWGGPARALLLPGCGHTPHREQPEVALEAMRAFIAEGR